MYANPTRSRRIRSFPDCVVGFAPVMLLLLGGLAVLAGLSLLALPFLALADWWRWLRFASRMRQQGRFIAWGALEPRLQIGEGTLIVEQAQKAGIRVWWVQDDVIQIASIQPPLEEDLDSVVPF